VQWLQSYKAGLARLLHYTALDIHSTAWPSNTSFHTIKLLSLLHKCILNADKPGAMAANAPWPNQSVASMVAVAQHKNFSFQICLMLFALAKMKNQHYCTPTWMLFLLLAFALLDELEPTYFPARQAQPTSTHSSHPLREGPGPTGNLTEAPVYEQHQQLPGQLLCLTPSVVICAGQQGQHCQAGPQRWHCTQLLAQQQYCCPTATVCKHCQL